MSTTSIIPDKAGRRHTFAEHSHPERDERPGNSPDPTLQAQLAAYKSAEHLSNSELAKRIGYKEGTPVSKYLNDKWDRRDLPQFETAVRDLLRTASLRQRCHVATMRTSVVRQVEAVLDSIRQTGTIGVIHGEAGVGKTTGLLAYVEANPSAIYVAANRVKNDERGILSLIVAALGLHGYKTNESYWDFLARSLRNKDRLLVVDHAQRLSKAAVDTLFDLHDQTGTPIALSGNPAILAKVATDDNNHSRALKEYGVRLKEVTGAVRHVVSHFTDEGDTIEDLALDVVRREGRGRLRALVNLLRSAADHYRDDRVETFRQAFELAKAESIRHKA